MASHSSVLAWRIPGTAEPGGLPSMGSHTTGTTCSSSTCLEGFIKFGQISEHLESKRTRDRHQCKVDKQRKGLKPLALLWPHVIGWQRLVSLGLDCCPIIHSDSITVSSPQQQFPGSSDGKAFVCNAGDPDTIPGLGRSLGEGNGNSLQYSCLENSTDGGAWWARAHGVTNSRT